jgi:hypothetical protein
VRLIELTPEIVVESTELPQSFHGVPADWIIVASVRVPGCVLVTPDRMRRRDLTRQLALFAIAPPIANIPRRYFHYRKQGIRWWVAPPADRAAVRSG